MSLGFSSRAVWSFAALLLSATLVKASLTATEPGPASGSLAGQLLIASPSMGDPRFARTVILMVRHDRDGALGIVINRPIGERPVAQILEAIGEPGSSAEGSVRIFLGGPVQAELGFVLHSAEYRRKETVVIDGSVAMTSSPEVLRDIATGNGPKKALVAFGYSGWGPGQLEGELKMQAWVVAPADPQLIFDEDRERVWDSAMARRPRDI